MRGLSFHEKTQMNKPTILTGDRTTGPLHIGQYAGSLSNRLRYQDSHEQFLLLADAQALTDNAQDPEKMHRSVMEVALDYLAVGIDPNRTTICRQSHLPALVELSMDGIRATKVASPAVVDEMVPADDWAGPVAGPTLLESHFGISRSTLYRWQKREEVVWLDTRNSKKPVFPLRQFVDGRPAIGIAEIVQACADPRAAWKWLMSGSLSDKDGVPVEELLNGDVTSVIAAARKYAAS